MGHKLRVSRLRALRGERDNSRDLARVIPEVWRGAAVGVQHDQPDVELLFKQDAKRRQQHSAIRAFERACRNRLLKQLFAGPDLGAGCAAEAVAVHARAAGQWCRAHLHGQWRL